MKSLNLIMCFISFYFALETIAQVKIGDNPSTMGASSALELESSSKSLVITRVASTNAISSPVNGMIVYDVSANCIKGFENGSWSGCYGATTPSVEVSCGGFSGTYNPNIPLSGAEYSITLINNTFGSSTVGFQTSDLVLSGVSGYSVSSVSASSITLAAGQSATITYSISGTATTTGTLTGLWSKLNLTCENNQVVNWAPNIFVYGSSSSIGPDNAYHTALLSSSGPYAAKGISIYSSNYLDGNLILNGGIEANKLDVNNNVSYYTSTTGVRTVTTMGAFSPEIGDNKFHKIVCPDNTIVTGIQIYSTTYLDDHMKIQCTGLNPGHSTDIGEGLVDAAGPGTAANNQNHIANCPASEYIKGIRIYANLWLDGDIGLYCTPIY